MRRWLKANDPFLRLAEVILIAVVGVLISLLQLRVANKQLALADLQTRITQSEISPDFRFSHDDNREMPAIVCKNEGRPVRRVLGDGMIYAALVRRGADTTSDNEVLYALELTNAADPVTPLSDNELGGFRIYHKRLLQRLADSVALGSGADNAISKRFPSKNWLEWVILIKVYAAVTYYDATGANRTERFTMDFPASSVEPVAAMPRMDSKIEVRDFCSPDGREINVVKLEDAIFSTIVTNLKDDPGK